MNEKNITSNSTKAIYMAITSPKEALDSLKLTKREDGKFYNLEANYKNYTVKGIIELDEFSSRREQFAESFIFYNTKVSVFTKFNFVPDKTDVLFKVITKENIEDD